MLDVFLGTVMGTIASAVAIHLFPLPSQHGFAVALTFVCAQMISVIHGSWSGIAATAISGLCLAVFLFEPVGYLTVESSLERNVLQWMLAGSFLTCPAFAWLVSRRDTP